jgi:hypothetical protein
MVSRIKLAGFHGVGDRKLLCSSPQVGNFADAEFGEKFEEKYPREPTLKDPALRFYLSLLREVSPVSKRKKANNTMAVL